MSIKINQKQVDKLFDNMEDISKNIVDQSYPYLRSETPIRTGNARNKTKKQGMSIKSNYGYAGSLDAGSSRQAPDGFTDPTIDNMVKILDREIRRL